MDSETLVAAIPAFLLVVGLFIWAATRSPGAPRPTTPPDAISKVGTQTAAGLACPNCGGTQFEAKRSFGAKARAVALAPFVTPAVAAAGLYLAPKSRVRCITCGTEYARG